MCYVSDKVNVELVETAKEEEEPKASQSRIEKDLTLIESSEKRLSESFGYNELNVEEESKFFGQKSKSREKYVTSDSESEDDETIMSQFNKSYLAEGPDPTRNVGSRRKPAGEDSGDKASAKKSAWDIKINQNISKSLKQTSNQNESHFAKQGGVRTSGQPRRDDSEPQKQLLKTEQIHTNDLPNLSSTSLMASNRNKLDTPRSDRLEPAKAAPPKPSGREHKAVRKPVTENFTSIELANNPITFGTTDKKKPEVVEKLKKNLGQLPRFDEDEERVAEHQPSEPKRVEEQRSRKLSYFGRENHQRSLERTQVSEKESMAENDSVELSKLKNDKQKLEEEVNELRKIIAKSFITDNGFKTRQSESER